MLTLTVSSNAYQTPDDAAQDLKRALVALRKRIARLWPGERMPFLAVFEKHKSGFPHLHLLIRARFMPVKTLREMWEGITKHSWNVNVMAIKTPGQLAYAAKYIGKDLSAFEHCKRWWRSHDYHQLNETDEERRKTRAGWSRAVASLPTFVSALRALSAEVEWIGQERVRWSSDPDGHATVANAFALASAYWPTIPMKNEGPSR